MPAADWSSLPSGLLETIARKLIFHADYIRFRTVCTAWRAATPEVPTHLPCQLPWLMLSENRYNSHCRGFVTIANNKLHYRDLPEASYPRRCCGSSHGWLAIVDECLHVFLINPLTRAKINLPDIFAFPNVISIDCFEAGREYTLRMPYSSGGFYSYSLQDMRESFIKRIVLSNSPSWGADFVALAILEKTGEVAYCKSDQNSWNLIEEAQSISHDVTYMNGSFYCLGEWEDVAAFDVSGDSPVVEIIQSKSPYPFGGHVQYLVHAKGELLLVLRFRKFAVGVQEMLGYKTINFKVFRFNFDELIWERLMSLGDEALFLGENSPVALLASDFPGCRGNRIYFADDYSVHYDGLLGEPDLGMFNLEDSSVEPLSCYPQDLKSLLECPPAVWISPNPCS